MGATPPFIIKMDEEYTCNDCNVGTSRWKGNIGYCPKCHSKNIGVVVDMTKNVNDVYEKED